MWIVFAVIVVFIFSRALNNAGKRGGSWREEDDWAQLDEDLENSDF